MYVSFYQMQKKKLMVVDTLLNSLIIYEVLNGNRSSNIRVKNAYA